MTVVTPRSGQLSQAFKANPYPFYARMRAESPVSRVRLPDRGYVWLVTRYDDAMVVLKDPRFVSDWRKSALPELHAQRSATSGVGLGRNLLGLDPPDHTRLRSSISGHFVPRRLEQLRGRIQELADELLNRVCERGEMDLIDDYAFPLPVTIIAELVGLRLKDWAQFRTLVHDLNSTDRRSGATRERILAARRAFLNELNLTVVARRREPRDDLLSALLHPEQASDTLSAEELIAMVFLLMLAGHVTTTNLLGNGILALLRHPDQLEKLRANPPLIASAVDELLRFDGPVELTTIYFAATRVELGGVVIRRGQPVRIAIPSVNHDEKYFLNPETLDITRDARHHLGFGQGIHYCLGATLGRMEAQIAISTLVRRMPELRLGVPPEALTWRLDPAIRGLEHLPLAF